MHIYIYIYIHAHNRNRELKELQEKSESLEHEISAKNADLEAKNAQCSDFYDEFHELTACLQRLNSKVDYHV